MRGTAFEGCAVSRVPTSGGLYLVSCNPIVASRTIDAPTAMARTIAIANAAAATVRYPLPMTKLLSCFACIVNASGRQAAVALEAEKWELQM